MGWFPRYSPSGKYLLRGNVDLTLNGYPFIPNGIAGPWLNDTMFIYRPHHDDCRVRTHNIETKETVVVGPVSSFVAAANNRWVVISELCAITSDGRKWENMGGGDSGAAIADDGTLWLLGHDGGIFKVLPNDLQLTQIAEGGTNIRASRQAVAWQFKGRIYGQRPGRPVEDLTTLAVGEEFWPIPFYVNDELWVMTFTQTRLQIRPWGSKFGLIVHEGESYYPDVVWDGANIRIAWTDRDGRPEEVTVQPIVKDDLTVEKTAPPPVVQPPPVVEPPPMPEPTSLLPTIERFRDDYFNPANGRRRNMTDDECVELCNKVAWNHRSEGWGLSYKASGTHGVRYDGTPCCHDVLVYKPTGEEYDVLVAAGAESSPTWGKTGGYARPGREWVAPIEPKGSTGTVPPPPVVTPPPPAVSLTPVLEALAAMRVVVDDLRAQVKLVREAQVIVQDSVDKCATGADLHALTDLTAQRITAAATNPRPVEVSGKAGFLGSVTLKGKVG